MMFDHLDGYRGTNITPWMIAKNVAPCTIAGWIWYCDVHDSHGSADSKDEAKHMVLAHEGFFDDGDAFEGCDLIITEAFEGVDE